MPEISKTCARYEEFAPAGPPAAFVACWWSFSIPPAAQSFEHAVVPDGTVSVVFIRKQSPCRRFLSVSGPRTNALRLTVGPGDSFCGARLLPGASRPLLGIAPAKLRDRVQSLNELAPELADRMLRELASAATARQCFAIMERELAGLAQRAEAIDRAISQATAMLLRAHGNAKIAGIATGAGLSERQFRRRFYEAVGLTPKEFSRIIRVRCACIHIAAPEKARLAAIAHGTGYADQAHLSREFARVFGSPAGDVSALLRGFEHGEFRESPMSVSFKT
jgi:AraC-like DNA-binding protein